MVTSEEEDSADWLQEASKLGVKIDFLKFVDLTNGDHAKDLYAKFNISSDVDKQVSLRKFVFNFQQTVPTRPPPEALIPPADADIEKMKKFFDQDVASLELTNDDHIVVQRMGWFEDEIDTIYWRRCYSYILCSTIAFFDKIHYDYVTAQDGQPRKKNTMVLTGVQGTGKSILGAIIGLFMAKLFGWEVNYVWKGKHVVVGDPRDSHRVIHIVDLSHGNVQAYPSGFVLIVSSANRTRWHSLKQQQTWTEDEGNYCFVDPATEAEVEAMVAKRLGEGAVETARRAFEFLGGVPRLCLKTKEQAKKTVDDAIAVYSMKPMAVKLSRLDDSSTDIDPGEKIYPGVVGHIIPTNSFRNHFKIQMASPYVARALLEKENADTDEKIQGLMEDLLTIPKARSFAGWIWEPLLTKKMSGDNARITIVGSTLPVDPTSPSFDVLLQKPTSEIKMFEFKDMAEFLAKAKSFADVKGDFCAFAKAASDTFAAIDAIVMIREGARFIIAALQLTVAEEYHPVKQSMIIDFVNTCRSVSDEAQPKLWFLQPEQCLSSFGFVKLQAMKFDEITYSPASQQTASVASSGTVRKSSRKRSRTDKYGKWVPSDSSKGKLTSNDMTYWNPVVQKVPQCVGIVHVGDGNTATEEGKNNIAAIEGALKKALANNPSVARSSETPDPTLRCWEATTKIMTELKVPLHASLMVAIERDIAVDKQLLDAAGYAVIDGGAADEGLE